MPWAKIDDQLADHPKILQAGPLASWMYICGLAYCARYLTDGYIPKGKALRLADVENPDQLISTLLEVGLWERVEGGYNVHDYLLYNPSKEQVDKAREKKQAAGQAGGQARAQADASAPAKTDAQADAQADASAEAQAIPKQYPVPVPVPNPLPGEPAALSLSEGSAGAPRETPVPLPKKTVITEEWLAEERCTFAGRVVDFDGAVRFAMNSTYFKGKPDKREYVHNALERQAARDAERNSSGRPQNFAKSSAGGARSDPDLDAWERIAEESKRNRGDYRS